MNAKVRLAILVSLGSLGFIIEGMRGIRLDWVDGVLLAIGFALFCFISYFVGYGAGLKERR